jgi:hypothetical protein
MTLDVKTLDASGNATLKRFAFSSPLNDALSEVCIR